LERRRKIIRRRGVRNRNQRTEQTGNRKLAFVAPNKLEGDGGSSSFRAGDFFGEFCCSLGASRGGARKERSAEGAILKERNYFLAGGRRKVESKKIVRCSIVKRGEGWDKLDE